jgi:class 3 adenylate cyclase
VLPTLVPGLLLVGLVLILGYLIRRAQADINLRAARVRELSARIESFMSSSARGAVRATPEAGDVPLKRVEVSLLYSDVRRFTEYSELASPEEVIAFLNRIMTLQIECVARHGGDVDKLIGDAMLARFEGAAKEFRAVCAALDIQELVERSDLPRGIGIGIFTGPAISGPIGPEARRDYTVIGDSVNMAARLCTEAQRGEIVADTTTLERSGAAGRFGLAEKIQVRGRERPVDIRRMTSVSPRSQMPLSPRSIRRALPIRTSE